MYTILITGINGFVGKHMARKLKAEECKVIGVGTDASVNEQIREFTDAYYSCDLTDTQAVAKLPLEKVDAVISLAGLANVGDSFKKPDIYKTINVKVLTSICERVMEIGAQTRIIAVSTGALYDPHQPMPLSETSATVQDGSPYSVSKRLMEEAAIAYRNRGLDCMIARPFNHFGPGQLGGFLVPDLLHKLHEYKQTRKPIVVGNLNTKRDYTDVRDVVRAYYLLATAESLDNPIYNICSGVSRSGKEVLDELCSALHVDVRPEIEVDKSLLRPKDPEDIYGSSELIKQAVGWQPEIGFKQTVNDLVNRNFVI